MAFFIKVKRNVPDGFEVQVILDNLMAHKTPTRAQVADETPPVPPQVHADLRVVDEPCGAPVLRPHYQGAPAFRRPQP